MSSKPLNPHAEEWRPTSTPTAHRSPAPPISSYSQHLRSFRHKCRRDLPPRLRKTTFTFTKSRPPPPPQKRKVWVKKEANGAAPKTSEHRRGATASETPASPPPPPPPSTGNASRTTVMIKNIPNKFRKGFMLDFLDGYCRDYTLEYDFLYLPSDFKLKNNLGYAFVNFTTDEAAKEFKRVLQNYKWKSSDVNSKKICDVTWAKFQGRGALVRRFWNCSFEYDSEEFLPVVLDPPRNGRDRNPPPPVVVGRLARG